MLEREHLECALLYPTIHLLWECEVTDPEITLAYCRAYNRWIADFCRDSGGRLVPIAHLTLLDAEGSAAELARAVADGCKGGWVAPFTVDLWCPVAHVPHVVLGHVLPLVVLAGGGALLGQALLSLRRR